LLVPQVYWLVVYWIAIFLTINFAQLVWLIYQTNEVTLSHKLGLIRAHSFPGMSSRAFLKLYEAAKLKVYVEDTVVVELGGATHGLSLITKGEVIETLPSGETRSIVNGQFFGDLTLVQPSSLISSPTLCTATKNTEIAYWTYDELAALFSKNERIKSGVFQAMSHALATKHTMRLT
jgi:signal-transduction protein with cAMP-binding, CBS, and nucleotidyltransferase domain